MGHVGVRRWRRRDGDRFAGTTPQATGSSPLQSFELAVEWNNVQTVLAETRGAIFTAADEIDPDPDSHFIRFVRIAAPDRKAVSDAELCQQVRTELAE